MDLHPNWVALSTIDFSWKNFVTENKEICNSKSNKNIQSQNNSLNGEEIKQFYLKTVSSSTTESQSYLINDVVDNTPLPKNSSFSEAQHIEPNERMVNLFLSAAQNNDLSQTSIVYKKYPQILNATDSFGWTALMCASRSNALDVVSFLLKYKANQNLEESCGRTAFSLAKTKEMKKLLTIKKEKPKHNKLSTSHRSDSNFFCEKCKEYLPENDKKRHISSTLHIFNSGQTQNKTFYGIPESNKGYQLLLRTGWHKESGLGPDGQGTKFPIKTVLKLDRQGFGTKTSDAKVTHFPANDMNAIKHRVETLKTLDKKQRIKNENKDKLRERAIREELS